MSEKRWRFVPVLAAVWLSWLALGAQGAGAQDAYTSLPSSWTVERVTTGPKHHFYGYQGHVGNTPFNASGTHLLLLETDFQDRYQTSTDAAGIVYLNLATKSQTRLTETRAWNFQQGTMMYWNPLKPDEEFFFNDRDVATNKIKTVLYNVVTRTRREYFNSSTPVGNSGVAQKGGRFLGINYGRIIRFRGEVGYKSAYDWTVGVKAPTNDGIWVVEAASGAQQLILSFKQMRDKFVAKYPEIDGYELFMNHTLWNRDDTRIFTVVRWVVAGSLKSIWFSCKPDGTDLIEFTAAPPGHPEWDAGNNIMTVPPTVYDTRTNAKIETIGSDVFTTPWGDLAVSRGRNWIAINETRSLGGGAYDTRVRIYSRAAKKVMDLPWYSIGKYHGTNGGVWAENRIDTSPCWNRDATKVYFFALAADGTRQAYVAHLSWGSAAIPPSAAITQPASEGTTVALGSTLSFAGTVSDADTSSLRVKWFIDRRGDGLQEVLLKDTTQAPGATSGTVVMSGTRTSTAGETVSLQDGGASYTLYLEVSDGVNAAVRAERTFALGAASGLSVTIDFVSTGKAYSLSTAQAGALYYIDRSYTIGSLSTALSGGKLIRTANDDKSVTTTAHLKFTVNKSATVYVCYDKRASQVPAWLSDGTWTVTTESFAVTDSLASPMRVYRKSVSASQVTLGGNLATPASGAGSHYVVVVK